MRLILPLLLSFSFIQSVIIETNQGRIKGREFLAKDGTLVHAFKKIPFAKSPLGEYRFALPETPNPWEGILDGTEYGPACMSNSTTSKSPQKWVDEDCLHVNVFVSDFCLKAKKGCPVVFYAHGGGFSFDSAVMYNDTDLINNFGNRGFPPFYFLICPDVVLVMSAFRLGFFALITFGNDNVVPRNLPVYDIIKGLNWVQDNIYAYGGDRKKVTLMGHSGGAAAVGSIAFSKAIDPKRKLFHRGIVMSGPAIMARDETLSQSKTWEFIKLAGCMKYPFDSAPSDNYIREAVHCLRKKDGHELLGLQRQMELAGFSPNGMILSAPLFPNSGIADFLSNPPNISLLIGANSKELDASTTAVDTSETLAFIMDVAHPQAAAEKYHRDKDENRLKFTSIPQTMSIFVGTHKMAQEITKTGADVYLYSYRYPAHPYHTDDLAYIMGVHKFVYDENEEVLSRLYPQYFINYIKTGVPDKQWEPFRLGDSNYFDIDVNLTTGLRPKNSLYFEKEVIDYWSKNITEFDKSLGSWEEERVATFSFLPVIFPPPNETVTPQGRGYLTAPISFYRPSSFSWLHLIWACCIMLLGFYLGRCSVGTKKKSFVVRLPEETTPLFYENPGKRC